MERSWILDANQITANDSIAFACELIEVTPREELANIYRATKLLDTA
jgi:hypothetical protein